MIGFLNTNVSEVAIGKVHANMRHYLAAYLETQHGNEVKDTNMTESIKVVNRKTKTVDKFIARREKFAAVEY